MQRLQFGDFAKILPAVVDIGSEMWQDHVAAARDCMGSDGSRLAWEMPSIEEVATADTMERYDFSQILEEEQQTGVRFIEKVRGPAVIQGLVPEWPISTHWQQLVEQIGDQKFEVSHQRWTRH